MQATAATLFCTPTFAAALLLAPSARADDDPSTHRLGDHPAVVVQRLAKNAGYDYASKFYPHPAGLRLYMTEPPRDAIDAAAPQREPERAPDTAAARADQKKRTSAVVGSVADRSGTSSATLP